MGTDANKTEEKVKVEDEGAEENADDNDDENEAGDDATVPQGQEGEGKQNRSEKKARKVRDKIR